MLLSEYCVASSFMEFLTFLQLIIIRFVHLKNFPIYIFIYFFWLPVSSVFCFLDLVSVSSLRFSSNV